VNRNNRVAALAAVSLLAGCGGDGSKEPTPQESTGVLHSRIQGVNYRTTTRSGKTDANGNFKYLPGETVTFSVGAIELGSAAGASNISLFTLAGMTPPTSELGLRRELDRMRYTSTPLARAANRARLLLALDGDGNPANGLDVSSFESALAGAQLSFDARLYDFQSDVSRLAPGMNNNIPESFPIKWLYRSLGVKLAGNVPVRSTDDDQDDGVVDSTGWSEVDAAGDPVSTFFDQDGDGEPDVTVTYQFDSLGRVTRQRTIRDFNLDHAPDSDRTVVTQFDAHGNAVRIVDSDDADSNGSIDFEQVNVSSFDSHGRILQSNYTTDHDHDGVVDATEVHIFTRDARGNLLRELTELADAADGQVDARYATDNTWDPSDRQLSSSFERDLDADGHVDNTRRWSATYGSTRQPRTYDEYYDEDGDGIDEQVLRTTYGYDAAGNITRSDSDYRSNFFGTEDHYRFRGEGSYNRDRRPLSFVYSYDFDLDGTTDSDNQQTFTYDANGFELTWKYVSNMFTTSPGGWIDGGGYSYSAEGAQTEAFSGTDFDADGVFEISRRSVIEYAPSNDSMAQIVGQYLGVL